MRDTRRYGLVERSLSIKSSRRHNLLEVPILHWTQEWKQVTAFCNPREYYDWGISIAVFFRVWPFFNFFGHNPVLIDHNELSAMTPGFSKLNNVYLCL